MPGSCLKQSHLFASCVFNMHNFKMWIQTGFRRSQPNPLAPELFPFMENSVNSQNKNLHLLYSVPQIKHPLKS